MFNGKSSSIITFTFFICFVSQLSAQYSKDDYEIVKTTYQRSFDENIIISYLNSEDSEKIKAVLLSVSHSEDTSFIPLITTLPFDNYSEMICFAIGQIGACYSSIQYLWARTAEENFPLFSTFVFEAIGKVGNEEDLNKIVELYSKFDAPTFPYDGISLAIMQFAFRGIKTEPAKQILIDEVNNQFNSIKGKNQALFASARMGSSPMINNELKRILLLPSSENSDTIQLKQFALMNFRTQKYFPSDEDVINNILKESNILLQIEIAKVICYEDFKTIAELDLYLNLIDSENPNVSRSAANSLRNIQLESEELKEYLESFLLKIMHSFLPPNTLGALIVSTTILFPHTFADMPINIFNSNNIPIKYLFNAAGSNNVEGSNLNLLIGEFMSERSLKDKIYLLSNLLKFQNTFPENEALNNIIISSLSSEYAPLVSIAADGIDSVLIVRYEKSVSEKLISTINKEKDNPDFMEGTMSLVNLAQRVDSSLFLDVIELLNNSNLYSIRKFIMNKTGEKLEFEKPLGNFDDLWKNAFTYRTAIIETEKGNFIIELLPEIAPVSVGNFCKLSNEESYDSVEFHRVVPGFVIQGGDPTETGWGGPGYEIISEFSHLTYKTGMIGMASAGIDTEGSQWFIMQGNYPHLNGRYSIFARVLSGMNVIYAIDQNDKIINVQLFP